MFTPSVGFNANIDAFESIQNADLTLGLNDAVETNVFLPSIDAGVNADFFLMFDIAFSQSEWYQVSLQEGTMGSSLVLYLLNVLTDECCYLRREGIEVYIFKISLVLFLDFPYLTYCTITLFLSLNFRVSLFIAFEGWMRFRETFWLFYDNRWWPVSLFGYLVNITACERQTSRRNIS